MADQDSQLLERLVMDHELSPPWTSLNIAKTLKFGLLIKPPEQDTIERNIAFQMETNGITFQEQSWIPNAPKGGQMVFIPLQEQTTIWYPPSWKSTSSISTCV